MMTKHDFIRMNRESEIYARWIPNEMTFTVKVSSKVDYSVVIKA